MFSDTQLREAFHFCFLHRLLKISAVDLYILKGGANLRFFFGSPRYSEDMDLDVVAGSVATLRKNGYKILEDPAFQRSLRVFDIDAIVINDPVNAKHTETTQRFACSLVRGSGMRLPAKVEFSRRADDPDEVSEDDAGVYEMIPARFEPPDELPEDEVLELLSGEAAGEEQAERVIERLASQLTTRARKTTPTARARNRVRCWSASEVSRSASPLRMSVAISAVDTTPSAPPALTAASRAVRSTDSPAR